MAMSPYLGLAVLAVMDLGALFAVEVESQGSDVVVSGRHCGDESLPLLCYWIGASRTVLILRVVLQRLLRSCIVGALASCLTLLSYGVQEGVHFAFGQTGSLAA